MAFILTTCGSCGKEIQVPDDIDSAKCMYCGCDVNFKKSITPNVSSIDNFLTLARTAGVAGNYKEAYTYYNRVLEIDPHNVIAWYGKGESAGWLSNLKEFRFSEMLIAFQNALRFSEENQRIELERNCALTINNIAAACYQIANKHLIEFVALPNTWPNYIAQCGQIITIYEEAHKLSPTDRLIMENIIHLCKDNIEGVKYNDPYDNNTQKITYLVDAYEQKIKSILNCYAEKIKQQDSSYVPPNPQRKSTDCFVVTATMGNETNYSVQYLRTFRDDYLNKSNLGRKFISWYYKNGPKLANIIKPSYTARLFSFILIVLPAIVLAKLVVFISNKNNTG